MDSIVGQEGLDVDMFTNAIVGQVRWVLLSWGLMPVKGYILRDSARAGPETRGTAHAISIFH